ncbi:hypothetical protein BCON_0048g00390 [Botryotinia convoluta]|uniref:SprT-like domain-containing protein n=1 Tax=Botryotinia convoluta TaxID=54673 RepID=A0A4Z1IQT2_9HELO|nr:hypothetical protein BCON_0048g00390 [Botryotinia convoluta]
MPCKHEYLKESEEQDLFQGKATRKNKILTVNHHKVSYLATLLVENASHRGSELTDVQREARHLRFDAEQEKYSVRLFAKELSKHDSTSKSYLDLVKEFTTHYITIYDKLFFFGCLLATKRMSYHVERREARTAMYEAVTIPIGGPDNHITHTRIEVYVEPEPGFTTEEQTRDWLGTLAHEVLHSFMLIFGCDGCGMSPEQAGPRGHGHGWQAAAYQIEIACNRLLSNNVSLGRWASLSSDVEDCGMPMPEERLLRNWKMIGPEFYEQTPEVPESAGKTNNVAKKSSEPSSAKTQLPHRPTEKLGGDHDKREGTGKSGERAPPRKDDKGKRRDPPHKDDKGKRRDPPHKDDRGERREPPKSGERVPPKSGERVPPKSGGSERVPPKSGGGERVPPKSGGGERVPPKSGERIPPRKDDRGERRDLPRSKPNEEIGSSRNTSRQDLTPVVKNESSRKPDTPKRRPLLG